MARACRAWHSARTPQGAALPPAECGRTPPASGATRAPPGGQTSRNLDTEVKLLDCPIAQMLLLSPQTGVLSCEISQKLERITSSSLASSRSQAELRRSRRRIGVSGCGVSPSAAERTCRRFRFRFPAFCAQEPPRLVC